MGNKIEKDWLEKGNEFYNSGNFGEAIKCYAEAVCLNPSYAGAFNNWGNVLVDLAKIKQDESLFKESFEKYAEATRLHPNDAAAFYNWGNALAYLARIKQNESESLLWEAIEKFAKAAFLNPVGDSIFNSWGTALADLAEIKQDESLFWESIEKFAKAAHLNPNYDSVFYNWGNMLYHLAEIKQDESLFLEAIEKYSKAVSLNPNYDSAFNNWGNVLADLAEIKQDKSLLQKAIEKYTKAICLNPNHASSFYNLGNALSILAQNKQDESLFKRSFEKYAEAARLNPNLVSVFNNWGFTLIKLAEIKQDEVLLKKSFEKFYKESDSLKKLDKSILEILVLFSNENMKKVLEVETFYPLLDLDWFFKETTKDTDKRKLDEYKKAYILSISIISQLHISNESEKLAAYYTNKTVSQKMLFDVSKFRLNAINYSNDPTEGKTLLNYLFGEKCPKRESLNTGYGAFAGCFTFNYDSLNQFRLYGKEEGKEGTGLSLVFRDSFFSKEAKMAMQLNTEKSSDSLKEEEKHTLFRCMYIDPIPMTQRIETVGHKEAYLFYREKNENETDEDIEKKTESYREYIASIINNVRKKMGELSQLVQKLDPAIVGQLLINLRYLTKHIAFKEEQECRIIKISRLNDEKAKIHTSDDFKQMYVEYEPKVSNHVDKIYFGPNATGLELFQDILTHKKIHIPCEKSTNPLA